MITYHIDKESSRITYDKFSKFVLLGNNIDGRIDINCCRFDNFSEVKKQLPNLVENMQCWGEWDLKLYQVPDNFNIKVLYGYYQVPQKGKLILKLSYMNINKYRKMYIDDAIIHVHSWSSMDREEQIKDASNTFKGSVYEEFLTVLLYQNKVNKASVFETYSLENEKSTYH